MVNVGNYTIHGSYGNMKLLFFLFYFSEVPHLLGKYISFPVPWSISSPYVPGFKSRGLWGTDITPSLENSLWQVYKPITQWAFYWPYRSESRVNFPAQRLISGVNYMTPTKNFMYYKKRKSLKKTLRFHCFDPPRIGVVDPRMSQDPWLLIIVPYTYPTNFQIMVPYNYPTFDLFDPPKTKLTLHFHCLIPLKKQVI